jgi:hypothetical protein
MVASWLKLFENGWRWLGKNVAVSQWLQNGLPCHSLSM